MSRSWSSLRTRATLMGVVGFSWPLFLAVMGETGPDARLYCTCVALGLALLVGLASGPPSFALFMSGGLLWSLRTGNAVKERSMETSVLASDLRLAIDPEIVGVLLKSPQIIAELLLGLFSVGVVAAMLWSWSGPSLWARVSSSRRRAAARLCAVTLAATAFATVLGPSGPFRDLYGDSTMDFMKSIRERPLTSFFVSFARMRVREPAFQRGAERRFDWSEPVPVADGMQQQPDIVAVLEESTFPPRLLAACRHPACDAAMFSADERTGFTGLLQVHMFGGASWMTEFAFFCGLPSYVFGSAGIYAPYNLAPRMRVSLPRTLKALGYRTVAVYGWKGELVNTRNAYREYGFDAFYDAHDLDLVWDDTDIVLERHVESVFQNERKLAGDAPLFVFVVTNRQHMPHSDALERLPTPFDRPLFPGLGAAANLNLGNYLARLRQSDQAITALESFLFEGSRPAVLLHFGDHQPPLGGFQAKLAKQVPADLRSVALKLTYFTLKTVPSPAQRGEWEVLDVSYLAGLLLQAAGLQPDAYFGANILLRERCKGRWQECSDAAVLESFYAEVFGTLDVFSG